MPVRYLVRYIHQPKCPPPIGYRCGSDSHSLLMKSSVFFGSSNRRSDPLPEKTWEWPGTQGRIFSHPAHADVSCIPWTSGAASPPLWYSQEKSQFFWPFQLMSCFSLAARWIRDTSRKKQEFCDDSPCRLAVLMRGQSAMCPFNDEPSRKVNSQKFRQYFLQKINSAPILTAFGKTWKSLVVPSPTGL